MGLSVTALQTCRTEQGAHVVAAPLSNRTVWQVWKWKSPGLFSFMSGTYSNVIQWGTKISCWGKAWTRM